MHGETEGAMKISASRASEQAPTWYSCTVTPKSLSGQPLDLVWIRLARKGFWGYRTAMSCGGSFRSSWRECSHSAFNFVLHFFYHPNLAVGTMWEVKFERGQIRSDNGSSWITQGFLLCISFSIERGYSEFWCFIYTPKLWTKEGGE